MCATCGIFLIYLPIPIVVTSFASCYRNRLWRSEILTRKRILNRKKQAQKMAEEKKALFNFANIGVHISNTMLDRLSTHTDLTPLPQYEDTCCEDDESKQLLFKFSSQASSEEECKFLIPNHNNVPQPDIIQDAHRSFSILHTDV